MKRFAAIFLAFMLAEAPSAAAQTKAEVKTVGGVAHVLNPAKPLKGTIELEVERSREINPYDRPEVGLRRVRFARDQAGQLVLYDPSRAEAHRYAADGRYLGLLTRIGQGPGEFGPMQGYRVNFDPPDIFVFGGRKMARVDGDGHLIKDRSIRQDFDGWIDGGRFFSVDMKRTKTNDQIRTLELVTLSTDGDADEVVDLLRAEESQWTGRVRGGLGDAELLL
jgi:hypothetical protein